MTVDLAHGVGSVYQLPLPLSLYLGGAALAVIGAFVVQLFSRGHPLRDPRRIASSRVSERVVHIASIIGLAWILLVVLFSFLEPENGFTLAPLLFWVVFVVGGVVLSTLVAGLWERANPWITVANMAPSEPDDARRLRPPTWLGPLLIYLLFWFELVTPSGFDPGFIFVVLALYTGYVWSFRARFGEGWRLADPFGILFGLAERSAPLQITDDGVFYRGPIAGLVEEKPMPMALFASVFILLASTTLDNARETIAWSNFLRDTGLNSADPILLGSIALALFSLPFLLPYLASIAIATRWVEKRASFFDVARTYAWSLAPIGIAYVLAHNMPLFIIGAPLIADQMLGAFTGDALATYEPSPKLVWFLEIAFIVIGHVLGVVSAHRIAQRVTRNNKDALKSHVALTVLMSLFTIGTLFLLAQPLVRR